ncbi:unnamed protein product, partial [Onchocerca ochengi]
AESGASLPNMQIGKMMRNREMGKYRKQPSRQEPFISNKWSNFTPSRKANLANRFFPNRDETTRVTSVALLRCFHLPNERLFTLSQDNILRFHMRQKSQRYRLLNSYNAPSRYRIITDITRSTKGDHLAYTTLDSYLYYFHVNRINEPMRWNLFHLVQPNTFSWNICSNVSFNMEDNYLFVVESGGQLGVIRIDIPRHHRFSFNAHRKDILAVGSSKCNPGIFYTAASDGLWKVWDNRSSRNVYPVQLSFTPSYNIAHIDSDSQDKYIVTTSCCGTRIDVWDLRFPANEPFENYQQQNVREAISILSSGHISIKTGRRRDEEEFFLRAKFSPQITGHRYIYVTSSIGYLYIFDIVTGEVRSFHQQGTLIYNSSWHPDNSEISCVTVRLINTLIYYKE